MVQDERAAGEDELTDFGDHGTGRRGLAGLDRSRLGGGARRHLPIRRASTVLGDLLHQVHVEPDDLAALLELERLVGQRGADRQLAVLDDLDPALGGLGVRGAGTRGENEGGRGSEAEH